MKSNLEKVTGHLEALALETVILDSGDIPALGNVLKSTEKIESVVGKKSKDHVIRPVVAAMKDYVEQAIMGEVDDLTPFEKAVSRLQEICRRLARNEPVEREISGALELFHGSNGDATSDDADASIEDAAISDEQTPPRTTAQNGSTSEPVDMSDDDKAIIIDFATESLENLSAIEVAVMDLEQNPSDIEAINAIFRPFHTIKGVSGFLNFTRINTLSHTVENLLDKVRLKELSVTEDMVDIILDSVDLLNQMIQDVQAAFADRSLEEGGMDIQPLMQRVESYIAASGADGKVPLGEVLVSKGAVEQRDIEEALAVQEENQEQRLGEILIEQKKIGARDVISALREQRRSGQPAALQVKVDTRKLDSIVDMVGELAIAQSMLRQSSLLKNATDRGIYQISNQLNVITSSLQKTAMSLRMVPIKHTFQKMLRLVRDLAKKAEKEVALHMFGEDTEIDRNMVEEIYEPMVHMIRNSVDHGLETPEDRLVLQKPREGIIHLRAYHKGGDIVIEIEDDGRGLDKEKILQMAVAKGLVKENENLTDMDIHQLIFHPGFSTADRVTDISGRGVGTDVVKSKIEKLRGRVEVKSTPDQGTCFILRLPLTLAIVDGMIVKVDEERYIIPTLNVQEFFQPQEKEYITVKGKGEMIKVREELIPLIRLDELPKFAHNGNGSGQKTPPWEKLVVVLENQDKRNCLLVDELVGQEEVVIKSLGQWLKYVKGIAGGAILGDGQVGLILDVSGVFDLHAEG